MRLSTGSEWRTPLQKWAGHNADACDALRWRDKDRITAGHRNQSHHSSAAAGFGAAPQMICLMTHEPRQGRQVLDCGDGDCAVTALAWATPRYRKLAADAGRPTESGDSA